MECTPSYQTHPDQVLTRCFPSAFTPEPSTEAVHHRLKLGVSHGATVTMVEAGIHTTNGQVRHVQRWQAHMPHHSWQSFWVEFFSFNLVWVWVHTRFSLPTGGGNQCVFSQVSHTTYLLNTIPRQPFSFTRPPPFPHC